ncbi:MAG: hypothetical protein ACRD52_17090, partial [Candidatus Acidiferrales bacterium]
TKKDADFLILSTRSPAQSRNRKRNFTQHAREGIPAAAPWETGNWRPADEITSRNIQPYNGHKALTIRIFWH